MKIATAQINAKAEGINKNTNRVIKYLKLANIVGFVDSDPQKIGPDGTSIRYVNLTTLLI